MFDSSLRHQIEIKKSATQTVADFFWAITGLAPAAKCQIFYPIKIETARFSKLSTYMISNSFSPDHVVLIYTAISVVLCVLIYKARSFSRFDWHSKKMNEVVGSGRIRQVDINSGDPARNAGVAAGNLANSMSAANGASLFVLAFFLFGSFAGSVAVPAALGMMSSITTLNLLALIVAGLSWGLGLGRLTMSLTKLGFTLAVWAALIVALLFVINFAFSFLNGGKDLFWNSAVNKVNAVKDALYNYDRAPKGSWFSNYEEHRKQNICALYESIRTKGDISETRRECNHAAWVLDQESGQEQRLKAYEAAANQHKATMKKLSAGLKTKGVAANTTSAIGTWGGQSRCNEKEATVNLMVDGQGTSLHGVIQIYAFGGKPDDMAQYTAYKFTGTQVGTAVDIHPGEWIQEGSLGKKMDLHFKLNSGKYPSLAEVKPEEGCKALWLRGFPENATPE